MAGLTLGWREKASRTLELPVAARHRFRHRRFAFFCPPTSMAMARTGVHYGSLTLLTGRCTNLELDARTSLWLRSHLCVTMSVDIGPEPISAYALRLGMLDRAEIPQKGSAVTYSREIHRFALQCQHAEHAFVRTRYSGSFRQTCNASSPTRTRGSRRRWRARRAGADARSSVAPLLLRAVDDLPNYSRPRHDRGLEQAAAACQSAGRQHHAFAAFGDSTRPTRRRHSRRWLHQSRSTKQ